MWTTQDAEEPLKLSAELRGELTELFGTMDHSVANRVMATVTSERARRRTMQSLWLGLSPVLAVLMVIMLYVGGSIVPAAFSTQASRLAMGSPGAAGFTDSAPKAMLTSPKPSASAAACQPPSLHIMLHGDTLLRQTLIIWLRSRQPDVALQVEQAASGESVAFDLNANETASFAALMVVHGFVGQSEAGLRVASGYSFAWWISNLNASSLHICCIP